MSGVGFGVTACAMHGAQDTESASSDFHSKSTPASAEAPSDHPPGVSDGIEARVAEEFGAFLDRERPQVVHFESLDVFGTQLVREAKARGIRSVYCASDTWPAHDSPQLLLPDLVPFELGDGEAEARGHLAVEEFGREAIEAGTLDTVQAARLKHLLHEPLTSLEDVARLREAAESVELRRAAKRISLSAVDRRFATTRLLAKNLSASVGRAFTFRATGLDTGLFQAPENRIEPAAALRFVYFGTTAIDTGIDVLLEAFGTLRREGAPSGDPATGAEAGAEASKEPQLVLMLECQDAARDAEIASRAQELRIETRWTRGPSDVVGGLNFSDIVIVPTLWGEVSPAACRVAFATGHPVLASRTPGIAEVAPSMAAMLVTPGDADALAEAIQKLSSGEAELDSMVAGAFESARSTKSIEDEAREWLDTYEQLLTAQAPVMNLTAVSAKDALTETRELLTELHGLSMTELFARAQEGVGKLRRAFGLADTDAELLARVVARGGQERDRAAGERRLRRELEVSLNELRAARERMELEEAARARRVADLHGVLGQYEKEVLSRKEDASRAVEAAVAQAHEEAVAAASRLVEEAQGDAQREVQAANERAEASARKAQEDAEAAMREAEAAAQEATSKALAAAEQAASEARAAAESAEADAQQKVAAAAADASKAQDEAVAAQKELGVKAAALKASQEALQGLETRAKELEEERAQAAAESDAAREQLQALEEEIQSARSAIDETEEERARMAKTLEERDSMVRDLRQSLGAESESESEGASDLRGELSSIEAFCVRLERDTEELKRHDAWMQEQTSRLVATLVPATDTEASQADPKEGLERGLAVLERLRSELDWRRTEMASAREASESVRVKLLAGPLAARVRGWGTVDPSRWAPVPVDRTEAPASADSTPKGQEAGESDVREPESPLPRTEDVDDSEVQDHEQSEASAS